MKFVNLVAHSRTVSDLSDNANKGCKFKGGGGGGRLGGFLGGAALGLSGGTNAQNATDEHVKVIKVLVSKVIPNSALKDSWDLKHYLSRTYARELEKLPNTFSPDLESKFRGFFKKWGQGFIATGYYGGEARIDIRSDVQGTLEISGGAGSATIGAASLEHYDSSDHSYQGSTLSLTSLPQTPQYSFTANTSSTGSLFSRNMVSNADFLGGNQGNHWKQISRKVVNIHIYFLLL